MIPGVTRESTALIHTGNIALRSHKHCRVTIQTRVTLTWTHGPELLDGFVPEHANARAWLRDHLLFTVVVLVPRMRPAE